MTDDDKAEAKASDEPKPEERRVETEHELRLGKKRLRYQATAGTLFLKDAKDAPRASVFHVAYIKQGVKDASKRPITFAFNGGPGSSAVWLQLGTFGPRRVDFPDAVAPPPPPYALVDNAETLLDVTDLVFIDPVGTGFSRALGDTEDKAFHTVKEDVRSVADFISLYLTREGRWNSPRFLAGESYGTTRAAALSAQLADQGIATNGIVLLSAALEFQSLMFEVGNDLPHVLTLPSYAAAAHYHGALGKKPPKLQTLLKDAREFAMGPYATALMRGSRIGASERKEVVQGLSRFTGLSERWIDRAHLRLELSRVCREVLRDRGLSMGRLDSRYTAVEGDGVGEHMVNDPAFTGPFGPYASAMNHYLRQELGYHEDRRYEIINMAVNESWTWPVEGRMGYVNTTADLRRVMLSHPHLKVFFGNGYYDLATPFLNSEHTASHLGGEDHIRANITEAYYEAGHMMYLHPPSRRKLAKDLHHFYESALR